MADLLEMLGSLMSAPGEYTRGVFAGQAGERLNAEDLLRAWGVRNPGPAATFATSLFSDPLNYAVGGAAAAGASRLGKLGRATEMAGDAPTAVIPNDLDPQLSKMLWVGQDAPSSEAETIRHVMDKVSPARQWTADWIQATPDLYQPGHSDDALRMIGAKDAGYFPSDTHRYTPVSAGKWPEVRVERLDGNLAQAQIPESTVPNMDLSQMREALVYEAPRIEVDQKYAQRSLQNAIENTESRYQYLDEDLPPWERAGPDPWPSHISEFGDDLDGTIQHEMQHLADMALPPYTRPSPAENFVRSKELAGYGDLHHIPEPYRSYVSGPRHSPYAVDDVVRYSDSTMDKLAEIATWANKEVAATPYGKYLLGPQELYPRIQSVRYRLGLKKGDPVPKYIPPEIVSASFPSNLFSEEDVRKILDYAPFLVGAAAGGAITTRGSSNG